MLQNFISKLFSKSFLGIILKRLQWWNLHTLIYLSILKYYLAVAGIIYETIHWEIII